jgi:hypothetical protein
MLAVALVLLGVPVWFLTRGDAGESKPAAAVVPRADVLVPYTVRLKASAPARLSAMVAGKPSADSGGAVREFETVFEMPEAEPEDVAVFADFGEGSGECAVRIEVERAGRVLADRTFWGSGVVEDVVVINEP